MMNDGIRHLGGYGGFQFGSRWNYGILETSLLLAGNSSLVRSKGCRPLHRTDERWRVTDERKLLQRAQSFDEQALAELYDRYAPLIYAYLYRRVRSAQLAEDLTAETFVRVLEAIQADRPWHTSFRSWLYRIAHNLVIDHFRQQPPQPSVGLDEQPLAAPDDLETVLSRRLSRRRLQQAIELLTVDQQHVLALRFGQQMTAREVAALLGKSEGAIEALQRRALAALRRILEEEVP